LRTKSEKVEDSIGLMERLHFAAEGGHADTV
jgi:hypothetical protein